MQNRFFVYHYLHVCILLIGITLLLVIVLVIKPNLAKQEYFSGYSQNVQVWIKTHQSLLNKILYGVVIFFILMYSSVVWKQVIDIPAYIAGDFERISGEVVAVKSNGHWLELDNGESYVVDLKGAREGDKVVLQYLPLSHCSSFVSINGEDVHY